MKRIVLLMLGASAAVQGWSQEFKVKGELKSFAPVEKVYLTYNNGTETVRDSALLQKGAFAFSGKIAEPVVAGLQVKYAGTTADGRPRQESKQIFLEPTNINIVAKDSLGLISVSGSEGHVDLDMLQKKRDALMPAMKALYDNYARIAKEGTKEDREKMEREIGRVQSEMDEAVWGSFVKKNPRSPVALYALQQYLGWDIDPAKAEPLFNSLSAANQQRPSAVALKSRIEIAKRTAIGNMAMDFTQNDTLGKPVALSSFRGKYVLVDFWASWCGPCRRENPNVVKAFNQFKDKGFTVLGVSLDRPNAKDKWLKAIHDDGLTWTQVSDLKFWDNEVAKQYGIRAIPQNLLIDPQGKIVAKNLNGETLRAKLEELMGK